MLLGVRDLQTTRHRLKGNEDQRSVLRPQGRKDIRHQVVVSLSDSHVDSLSLVFKEVQPTPPSQLFNLYILEEPLAYLAKLYFPA